MKRCAVCGAPNEDDRSECKNCGRDLSATPSEPGVGPSSPGPEAPPEGAVAPSQLPPPDGQPVYPAPPQYGYPGQQPPLGQAGHPYMPGMMPGQNAPAVTSALVFSIIGFACCFIFAIIGIVQAQTAKQQIAMSGGAYGGANTAQAALIIGVLGCIFQGFALFLQVARFA